ncbi:MAG TPA: septal ring lytic transglycosylase RlpA family protein [Candidatus Binatia bacterium]|nr:septal ring lytic transglycosylase RlpA family protein [Candidatus Binatia bacterium]
MPVAARRGATQIGTASWYGPGFHGNPTSSGEIYDQNDLTGAHQTLPLGTRVAVTNLENGRSVEVRINDRGPFVDGRIIDLSHAAARALGMLGPGTAAVRIEVLGSAAPTLPTVAYAVQVGSFADRENAARLRAALARRFDDVRIATLDGGEGRYYRVRVGRFSSRRDALNLARSVAPLGLSPIIVEDGAAP